MLDCLPDKFPAVRKVTCWDQLIWGVLASRALPGVGSGRKIGNLAAETVAFGH